MTVKELKTELEKYPDNMDVFMDERLTEFKYGLVNGVTSQEITFAENPDFEEGDLQATDTVVIISED